MTEVLQKGQKRYPGYFNTKYNFFWHFLAYIHVRNHSLWELFYYLKIDQFLLHKWLIFGMISDHSKKQPITLWKRAIICAYPNGRLMWKVTSWKVRKKATEVCRRYAHLGKQNVPFEFINSIVAILQMKYILNSI